MQNDDRQELTNAEVKRMRNTEEKAPSKTTNTSFRAHKHELVIFEAHFRKASGNPKLSRTNWYSDMANRRCRVSIHRDAKIIKKTSTRSANGKRGNRTIRVFNADHDKVKTAKSNMILKYRSITQLVQAIVAGECEIIYKVPKKK